MVVQEIESSIATINRRGKGGAAVKCFHCDNESPGRLHLTTVGQYSPGKDRIEIVCCDCGLHSPGFPSKEQAIAWWEKMNSALTALVAYQEEDHFLIKKSLAGEQWREYDFGGRIYRIESPSQLYYRKGGVTHRVIGADGITHCCPVPGYQGCVIRWEMSEGCDPVLF